VPEKTSSCNCAAEGIYDLSQHDLDCPYRTDAAAGRTKTYAEIAADYANIAGNVLASFPEEPIESPAGFAVEIAQVAATLSVGARLSDLTQRLEKSIEYVGDRIDAQETP
jgi:hypothetical protein